MLDNMKWERPESVTVFPVIEVNAKYPLRRAQRDYCAKVMDYDEILQTSLVQEDFAEKRKHRWKYMRNFFLIVTKPPFDKCSFENALFAHAHFFMTIEQFVMRIMLEFKFPPKMKMDDFSRWLYLSFDSHRQNNVDWREMLLYYKVLLYFRFVRDSPLDLILLMFDIYGEGGDSVDIDRGTKYSTIDRDRIVLSNAQQHLRTIFTAPCIDETEVYGMDTALERLFDILETQNNRISRKELENGFCDGQFNPRALKYYSELAWKRILPDQRLCVLDEAQTKHIVAAEVIISRFQLQQALVIYAKNTHKKFFRAWKIITVKASGARAFAQHRLRRRAVTYLTRWQRISRRYALYRRRRLLAQVMGDYAIKSRCFQRILLHNTLIRRITRISGSLLPNAKRLTLAMTHLREASRLYAQRVLLHRWRNICRMWRNYEISTKHYKQQLLRRVFFPWFTMTHASAVAQRQEAVVRENQLYLQRMLEEAELAAKEIALIEEARRIAQEQREKEENDRQQQLRLEKAKEQARQEREREKRALLREQADARTTRIKQEMKRLKAIFHMEFEFKAQEAMERTKDRTVAYIENPENKLTIDLKFEQLKREFHANPTPETREREKMLSSYKNILFLFINAQLRREKIELRDLFARYDVMQKGYLTYGEFATMIRILNTKLNEAQISNVIRHVDADRDGYITLQECEACMSCVQQMGAPGSSWKLYVDPAEDVICYHNFDTNEKFLEYEVTDKILRGITIANIYAEAEFNMTEQLRVMRREEWQTVLRNYMVRRLQYMYRVWKGRQVRKRLAWRVLQREQAARTKKMRLCADFIARFWRGKKCRRLFARQLAFTIEKVYDRESNQLFYYNHVTKEASWEEPRLFSVKKVILCNKQKNQTHVIEIGRQQYAAVLTEPCVWLPIEDETSSALTEQQTTTTRQWECTTSLPQSYENNFNNTNNNLANNEESINASLSSYGKISYFHINSKRVFPGKPDGFPLCCMCQYQLGVHACLDCYSHQMNTTNSDQNKFKPILAHYCFACHRATHSNPFGFHQHAKAKRSQYNNPDFVAQLYNFQHKWISSEPTVCDLCQGKEKMFAAFQCADCGQKCLCRKCFARIHHPSMKPPHQYFRI